MNISEFQNKKTQQHRETLRARINEIEASYLRHDGDLHAVADELGLKLDTLKSRIEAGRLFGMTTLVAHQPFDTQASLERAARMLELSESGKTNTEIAKEYGLSPQCIRQLLAKARRDRKHAQSQNVA